MLDGVTVVVPTYNRRALLTRTLRSLVDQEQDGCPPFEVVVCDDGSSDDTSTVVTQAARDLDIRYVWQPDRGHRVAAARNLGIALARRSVTVMLDCGAIAGPGYLRAHAEAHVPYLRGDEAIPRAVIGNTVGYRFDIDVAGDAARAVLDGTNQESLALAARSDEFADMRREEAQGLASAPSPWRLFWTTNVSVPTSLLRDVGGFDEAFEGWGAEDLELAYRMHVAGARFVWSDDAWALELPQPRDGAANRVTNTANMQRFATTHRRVEVELFVGAREIGIPVRESVEHFDAWQRRAASAGRAWPVVRWDLEAGVVEFDVVDGAAAPASVADGARGRLPILGLHTPFADGAFRVARFSRRLEGLWDRWGEVLLDEARRIASRIEGPGTLTRDPHPGGAPCVVPETGVLEQMGSVTVIDRMSSEGRA